MRFDDSNKKTCQITVKVLLTGGTGYVGKRLKRALAECGHEVRLLVRHAGTRQDLPAQGYEIFNGDALDMNACLRACSGCDAVVHLVGIIREFPSDGITFDALHVQATQNMVNAARMQGVKRFIHMSALGVRPDASSRYHRTKYAAEEVVRASSLCWTIFRPSVIFGPGDEFIRLLVGMVKRKFIPLIDGGKAKLQPVALEDVCKCMVSALRNAGAMERVFEVGGPERVAFGDLVRRIAAHLDVRARFIPLPAAPLKPVVAFLERFPAFPLTRDQLIMLLEDNVCDNDAVRKTFGLRPVSFLGSLGNLVGAVGGETLPRTTAVV